MSLAHYLSQWRHAMPIAAMAAVAITACTDDDREVPGSFVGSGPDRAIDATPCHDGTVRDCKVQLDDFNCFAGEQTCVAGKWGKCKEAEGLQSAALSSPAGCANNPCNPDCQTFDEVPSPGFAFGSGVSGGDLTLLPGGFQNKLLKDAVHPPSGNCTSSADCQVDHVCDTGDGECKPHAAGAYDAGTTDPNFTVQIPCEDQVVVCNRGGGVAPPGAKVLVFSGNSSKLQADLGTCSGFKGSVAGECFTASAIQPGECIYVSGCEAALSGTKNVHVNASDDAPHFTESECSDNWATYHANAAGACSPGGVAEVSEVYEANCPAGTRPRWDHLAYDATIPAGTSMEILAHTAATVAGLAPLPACADCVTLADIPSSEPAYCPLSGPSPCPLALATTLFAVSNHDPVVELVVRGTASGGSQPVLNSWELRYTCVDAE